MRNPTTGAVYILLEARLSELPGALPKAGKKKKGKADAPEQPPFEVAVSLERPAVLRRRNLHICSTAWCHAVITNFTLTLFSVWRNCLAKSEV